MKKTGSALVLIIVFSAMAILVVSSAAIMVVNSSSSKTSFSVSENSLLSAESGVENAIIKLIRDRGYTGETLNFNGSTVSVNVSGTSNKVITSTSSLNNYNRTIVVTGHFESNKFVVDSWQEL